MSLDLEFSGTVSVNDFGTFVEISNCQLLLRKNGRLLVQKPDDMLHKDVMRICRVNDARANRTESDLVSMNGVRKHRVVT